MALQALCIAGMAIQGITGVCGMVQSYQANKKNEEMAKKMKEDMEKSNQAMIAQFSASTGLSANVGNAGFQQGVPGGQFPAFMG